MGLFKKIADYQGTTHGVDPMGHNHSGLVVDGGYFGIREDTLLGIASIEADIDSQSGSISFEITPDNVEELNKLLNGGKAEKTHTHTNDSWLTTLLAGKADVEHTHTLEDIEDFDGREITSGGENEPAYVRAYTTVVGSLKRQVKAFCDRFILSIRGEEDVVISSTNLPNLVRALAVPDSTPTADSDNLVTSGGVAAALNGKAAASHTQAISTITGLQSALDGKLDGEVVELEATVLNPIVVDDMPVDKLILITQNDALVQHPKLKELIVKETGSTDLLHFHLNSGELTNTYYLVRRFTWVGGFVSHTHNFVEVVGAWD